MPASKLPVHSSRFGPRRYRITKVNSRAESVTETETEYRDISKKPKPKPTSVLRNRKISKKNEERTKNRKFGFANDDVYCLNIYR